MCGIYGIIASQKSDYSDKFLTKSFIKLAKISESRGKDSSGICVYNQIENRIDIVKGPFPIRRLIRQKKVQKVLSSAFHAGSHSKYAFGHARLVTNGTQLNDENNQPVIKDGVVGVHNGIIVNVKELWDTYPNLSRKYEIDTEVLLSLIRSGLDAGEGFSESTATSISKVRGTVAAALVSDDIDKFVLSTNNGSLYTLHNNNDILLFASERHMLTAYENSIDTSIIGNYEIKQVISNESIVIDLNEFKITESLESKVKIINSPPSLREKVPINIATIDSKEDQLSTVLDLNVIHLNPQSKKERAILEYPIEKIMTLRRCTKCLLPETFPYIEFNQEGVCNYCKNHTPKNTEKPLELLQELVNPYRKSSGAPEVLIPLSGGRDSTFALHVAKKELGLNAVAYTYDWGMVTDLARRNVARICGELGVENIIVAADIHWKRENIRKNINTWLKNPELGMIPLFMAGDKFFFYYAHKIKKQLGIDLEIWGVNELENTDFKTGFAGVRPQFDKKRIYSLSLKNHLKLLSFVGRNVIQNPGYINQSIFDSLGSFASRYFTPKAHYFHLYEYMKWDEKNIEDTILNIYGWEKAVDTESTWRIGDGTASFYNYIYTLIAGFSENDTFRSNQIREGMITREKALELVYEENKPRYNSLKWYFEIVGLDYESVINKINSIPRLYR